MATEQGDRVNPFMYGSSFSAARVPDMYLAGEIEEFEEL